MGKYRPVSTAEKRAQLEAEGKEWPVCKCHGEFMTWAPKSCRPAGGWWLCAVKRRATYRRWAQSERGIETKNRLRLAEIESGRAAERDAKRRSDPNFRRKKSLYMLEYHHRRKHERYADQGLTFRNDGEESSAGGDLAAA